MSGNGFETQILGRVQLPAERYLNHLGLANLRVG
jgi:hypothetical protein